MPVTTLISDISNPTVYMEAQAKLELMKVPAFIVSKTDLSFLMNELAKSFLTATSVEVKGKNVENIFKSESLTSPLREIIDQVAEFKEARMENLTLNSSVRSEPVEILLFPVFGDGIDEQICIQIFDRQIPVIHEDDKQANLDILIKERTAELNELNRFLTAIVDSSTETFIIAVGSNGLILSFNEGACHLFQRSKTEVVGREHIQEFIADTKVADDIWQEMIQEAQASGMCRKMVDMVQKSGNIFPALTDLTPLRNAENQVLGMLFVGRDVTESQITQVALEQRKQELEFINTLSLEMSQTLDPEEIGSVSLRNTLRILQGVAGCMYLKPDPNEDLKLSAIEVPSEYAFMTKHIVLTKNDHNLLQEGEILIREFTLEDEAIRKEFRKDKMHMIAVPLTSKGKYVGAMVIASKETAERTEELNRFVSAIGVSVGSAIDNAILYADTLQKSAEIKRQNKELDEFAYIVSHDLKEPLAGIAFIANLIIQEYYERFDTTGQTYITSLVDFSKRLDTLIDTLLDLSRIGRIIQPSEEVDINQVLREVRQNLSYRIENQNIKIIKPNSFPLVYGDKTRITQVFFNLMSNAMKFNDKEKPIVEIGFQEDPDEPGFITFVVRDNGIGIEEIYFDKIFKIFERLHSREEYEGTGAGLTIVKKIIEHHGGHIRVESVLDKGTTFYFTLPKYVENE